MLIEELSITTILFSPIKATLAVGNKLNVKRVRKRERGREKMRERKRERESKRKREKEGQSESTRDGETETERDGERQRLIERDRDKAMGVHPCLHAFIGNQRALLSP